jgi:hypothetical protein
MCLQPIHLRTGPPATYLSSPHSSASLNHVFVFPINPDYTLSRSFAPSHLISRFLPTSIVHRRSPTRLPMSINSLHTIVLWQSPTRLSPINTSPHKLRHRIDDVIYHPNPLIHRVPFPRSRKRSASDFSRASIPPYRSKRHLTSRSLFRSCELSNPFIHQCEQRAE